MLFRSFGLCTADVPVLVVVVIVEEYEKKMGLISEQLVVQTPCIFIELSVRGRMRPVDRIREKQVGLHAGLLIEVLHPSEKLCLVADPSQVVSIVTRFVDRALWQCLAFHRGSRDLGTSSGAI